MLNWGKHSKQAAMVGLLAAALMLLASGAAYAQTAVPPPGSGTQADPYQISELGHLVWMGATVGTSSGKHHSLIADIDASATAAWNDAGTGTSVLEGFKPIGMDYGSGAPFTGVFDGKGHTITGLVINRPGTDYVGLFGYVGQDGQVRNLGMVGGAVTGNRWVGALAGSSEGTVSGCYANTPVKGYSRIGGLIGSNDRAVSNCYAKGMVTGTGDYVGGLVGRNFAGGYPGDPGYVHASILNCYATGSVTGRSYVGGLAGDNHADHDYVNYPPHLHDASISNCYATGAVAGSGSYVGGLVGYSYAYPSDSDYALISNCYATGAVTGGGSYVGGLVGRNLSVAVSNSYWDIQTSGRNISPGGGVGKTTAEMKQRDTFAGWDFDTVPVWCIRENVTYPQLQSLPVDSDGDLFPDCQDNCPWAPNFDQADADGDGVGDVCDVCADTPAGMPVDADGCSCGQRGDTDGDGVGDTCDECADTPAGEPADANGCSCSQRGDTDGDGVGDCDDQCPDTVPGATVDANGCLRAILGDFNGDGNVDWHDVDIFTACATGPGVMYGPQDPTAVCTPSPVERFLLADLDLDHDGDLDSDDFAALQRCYTVHSSTSCVTHSVRQTDRRHSSDSAFQALRLDTSRSS